LLRLLQEAHWVHRPPMHPSLEVQVVHALAEARVTQSI
jgi:hypothetical protein